MRTPILVVRVQLPLGRNTFFFSSHIETFAWKINKTEVGSIILILFGAWRLRQKFSFGVSWNRIFFFLFFYKLVHLNLEAQRNYSSFIGNYVIISHTRQLCPPSRWVHHHLVPVVNNGNKDAGWIQGSNFFVFGINQGNAEVG